MLDHTPKHRDIAESPRAAVDPFASLDFDHVDEIMVKAFAGALQRWPNDITRAAADFKILAVDSLKILLGEEISYSYRQGVIATIAYILDTHPKHAFIADCIAFASNLHAIQGGLSETEIAKRHGVKRATVCKWVQIVRRELSLHKSRGMRDEEAQEAYRERAHRVHGTEPSQHIEEPIKVSSIESLVAKLCRGMARVNADALPVHERESLRRTLGQLKPVLASVGA